MGKLNGLGISNKEVLVVPKLNKLSKTRQCELLNISRSGTYYKPVKLSSSDQSIINRISTIYTENPDYGYRYIHRQLLEEGMLVGRDRVLKYMRMLNIKAIYPHKKKHFPVKNIQNQRYGYLLDKYWNKSGKTKTLHIPNANDVWRWDITYIRTDGGFVYLAAIIDCHSKAILSYKLSNPMDVTLVTDVLQDALVKYPAPAIFNSDQGSQYTGSQHIELLKNHNIMVSMNGKGRSIDNIVIERFFRTLKYNCIFINDFKDLKALKQGVNNYVDKYNYHRFHSSIC